MTKKIAHIVLDEKFIDCAYRIFEVAYPGKNVFFIVTPSTRKPFRYIKTAKGTAIHPLRLLSKEFVKALDQYEMVFLHWMDEWRMQLLILASPSVKFIWLGWGGDYYPLINPDQDGILLEKTASLLLSFNLDANRLSLDQIVKRALKFFLFKRIDKMDAIKRIDFFSPVLPQDYDLMRKALPDFKAQYMPWNYGTLEDDLVPGFENGEIVGENILFGNSATLENNHLDGFDVLEKVDLNNRQIICPLSYGYKSYSEFIKQAGERRFGKSFVPLMDFMPAPEYGKLINTCSCVIMNHLRQQGMGNIITMMYLGAKIFLQKSNPAYLFFREQGAAVFSIDEFKDGSGILGKLSASEIERNRAILRAHWSREAIHRKTKNLVEKVNSFHRN